MICHVCGQIFSGQLLVGRWSPTFGNRHHGESRDHHPNIEGLYQSALEECFICALVWKDLLARHAFELRGISSEDISFEQKSRLLIEAMAKSNQSNQEGFSTSWIGNESDPSQRIRALHIRTRNLPGTKDYQACPPQYRKYFWLDSSLHFFSLNVSPEHALGTMLDETRGSSTGSSGTIKVINWWLRDCIQNHKECESANESTRLPTRLLEIKAESNQIRVIETVGRSLSEPYMTLSHRWGHVQPLTLTKESLNALYKGVGMTKLPRTFREAVTVAKSLGVTFLWIDSLCIFQDSTEDWQKESSMMDTVYGNAICNIAATHSSDCAGGLFRPREPFTPLQTSAYTTFDGQPRENVEIWRRSKEIETLEGPLLQRGWVIQERVMAKRVVHFGKSQVYWECLHHSATEKYPYLVESKSEDFSTMEFKRSIGNIDSQPDSIDISARIKCWKELIIEYSKCELTREGDRLVALSGLAKRFRAMIGSRYVAGLWQVPDMASQLSWYTDYLRRNTLYQKSGTYLSPSWSWPSAKVPVTRWLDVQAKDNLKVLEISVTPLGLDDTGQLESGFLRVKGTFQKLLFPNILSKGSSRHFPISFNDMPPICGIAYYPDPSHIEEEGQYPTNSFLTSHNTEHPTEGHQLYSLFLGNDSTSRVYLVLKSTYTCHGQYRRCGILQTRLEDSLFDHWDEDDIDGLDRKEPRNRLKDFFEDDCIHPRALSQNWKLAEYETYDSEEGTFTISIV